MRSTPLVQLGNISLRAGSLNIGEISSSEIDVGLTMLVKQVVGAGSSPDEEDFNFFNITGNSAFESILSASVGLDAVPVAEFRVGLNPRTSNGKEGDTEGFVAGLRMTSLEHEAGLASLFHTVANLSRLQALHSVVPLEISGKPLTPREP